MAELEVVAEGLGFPEGPVALPDGDVLVVEIKAGNLTRVKPSGATEVVAELGGGPNGAAIGPDGAVYVPNNGGFEWRDLGGLDLPGDAPDDYTGGSIQRVDLDSGDVKTLYTECEGVPLRGPNDIVFDSGGGFYFTDMGKTKDRKLDQGAVYYAAPDGSEIREVAFPMDRPNGVGLSPDGGTLYVAETYTARVWSWPVSGPGQLEGNPLGSGGGTLLAQVPGYQLLDSLGVDGEGNVCVATLITGAVTVISPGGDIVETVDGPGDDPLITNICFGGDDLRTAYITSSGQGRLYKTTWPRPGLRLEHT